MECGSSRSLSCARLRSPRSSAEASTGRARARRRRRPAYLPVPGGERGEQFAAMDAYWNDRLTYPTGRFNPAWLRNAARQDARIASRVPPSAGPASGCELDSPRPAAGADGRLHRLLQLPQDRGPHQRDRGRPDDDDERLDRRLLGERRRRRLEDDELLQHDHDVVRHDRRPADLVDHDRHARDRPQRPQHDLCGHRGPQLRLLLDGQPGHPQVHRRRRHWTVLGADVFGPAYTSRRASSRSTTQSARCASTRTTATRSSPAPRRGSSSPTTAASTGPGPARPTPSRRSARTSPGSSSRTWAAAYADHRRGRRARFCDHGPVRPRHERRERALRRDHARQRLPDVHVDRVERERVRLRQRGLRQPVRDRREHERRQRRRRTSIRRPATSSAGSTSRSRRATRTCIYAQVQSIAREHQRQLRQRPRLPARRLGEPQRRHHLVVHGRLAGPVAAAACGMATTRRTGTTRGSPSTRTTRTASTSTRSTSGSRPAPARRSATSRAATTAAARASTSTSTRSRSSTAPRASCSSEATEARSRRTQANLNPPSPTNFFNMDNGPEHDRVLLGRHQRQLRDLAESVGRRRRAGQRAERRRLHGLPDRPGAVADDDRRRRLLRTHRPRRHRDEPALLRREQQRRHVALRQQLPDRRQRLRERDRQLERRHTVVHPAVRHLPRRSPGRRRLRGGRHSGRLRPSRRRYDEGLGDDRGRQPVDELRELVRHEQPGRRRT